MRAPMSPNFHNEKGSFLRVLYVLFFLVFLTANMLNGQRNEDQFVVVLDAGHGGHDPGNLGNGYLEKNIALNIVLNAGAILERTPGIKVIYTRKDDTFIDLYVRGEIANKANADLFVSVHCDSHTSNAHGAGTFVLGLHANKQNFEIAKKENSVIYLEDNYESRYADYDINSPESVIGLTIMQEEFLDQSITLAKSIQNNFAKKLKRKDRQVKQAGFIVLHQTFMPSVLVETGFLTNDDEGAYLNSKRGQSEMGASIAHAITAYRGEVGAGTSQTANTTSPPVSSPAEKTVVAKEEPVPDVGGTTSDAAEEFAKNPGANPIVEKDSEVKTKANEVSEKVNEVANATKEADVPKTTTVIADKVEQKTESVTEEAKDQVKQEVVLASQPAKTKETAKEVPSNSPTKEPVAPPKKEVVVKTPPKANTKNIIFKVQLMASKKDIALRASNFGGLNKLSKERFNEYHRYMYGNTDSFTQAKLLKSNADTKGYPTSYIVAYKDGVRIPTPEAIKLVSE